MALELESTIMREIGLGNHYTWFNGSGSCQYIRQDAAKKLSDVIKRHYDTGDEIAPPNDDLIAILRTVATVGDGNPYTLTKTWEAASYVIAEHIHQARASEDDREAAYRNIKQYIQANFLPQTGPNSGLYRSPDFRGI